MSPAGDTKNQNGWEPSQATLTNGSDHRNPTAYRLTVEQFDVTRNPRYQPRDGATWCNVFVWDVTRALACEIPHWWGRRELDANGLTVWLAAHGPGFGWRRLTGPVEASKRAALGHPTVAVLHNAGGSGHVAMVIPGESGEVAIAQAGAVNAFDVPLAQGFGTAKPVFYTHD